MGGEKSMFWFNFYRKEAQKIEEERQKIKQIFKKHINNQKEMTMLIFMIIINIHVFSILFCFTIYKNIKSRVDLIIIYIS